MTGGVNNVISLTRLIIETFMLSLTVDQNRLNNHYMHRSMNEREREREVVFYYAKADAHYFKTAEWNYRITFGM